MTITAGVTAGHWSLLVVDRTSYEPGIITYFDSLPNFDSGIFDDLKTRMIGSSPLARTGSRWIRASIPRQHLGSNDCGIYAACISACYTKTIFNGGRVVSEKTQRVDVSFDVTTEQFGLQGRRHILDSIETSRVDFDSSFFNRVTIVGSSAAIDV